MNLLGKTSIVFMLLFVAGCETINDAADFLSTFIPLGF